MDFSKLCFGVDGDSITAGNQWPYHVFNTLGFASLHNVAVGSAVWYKRTVKVNGRTISTQSYTDPDFAGISDGWEPTDNENELQKRLNNCAIVHTEKFIDEVKRGEYPPPDVFAFAMGTNDDINHLGNADDPEPDLFAEAGAMRYCLQRLKEEFKGVKIFILTPLKTANHEHNEKIKLQIKSIMTPIANAMGAQITDCFNGCGIFEENEITGDEGEYLIDGLHPKLNGQLLQGDYVAKEIRNNLFF